MRTVRLRLLPSGAQERRLRKLADVTARLWNELNYARLVQFRALGRVDFKGTGREFYRTDEKPRPLGRGRFKYWKKRLLLVSSPDQFLGNEERGLISPAISGGGIKEIKHSNRRAIVVRLLPNGFQERKLRRLADISAKLFNEVNYERRQEFFHEGRVDLKGTYEVL